MGCTFLSHAWKPAPLLSHFPSCKIFQIPFTISWKLAIDVLAKIANWALWKVRIDTLIPTELQRRSTNWRQEQFEVSVHRSWMLVSCNHSTSGSKTANFLPEDTVLDTELPIHYFFFSLSFKRGNRLWELESISQIIFLVLMYQFWKYFSTNKTITSFASYPSVETKLTVFLLSPHILPSLPSVLRFSTFYSVLSSSPHLPRCHFTRIIIHAMGTQLIKHFNKVSEHVVSPLLNIQISLLFSGILVL